MTVSKDQIVGSLHKGTLELLNPINVYRVSLQLLYSPTSRAEELKT